MSGQRHKMDYVSNRVFDGKRAISPDRANALRANYLANHKQTDNSRSLFGSMMAIIIAMPVMAMALIVRR